MQASCPYASTCSKDTFRPFGQIPKGEGLGLFPAPFLWQISTFRLRLSIRAHRENSIAIQRAALLPRPDPPMNEKQNGRIQAIQRIRLALIEKKMTQAELADAADCHEKTIQNLLAGRTVRDQTLFDACMVLRLDFDELKGHWSGDGPPGTPFGDESQPAGAATEIAPVYMGAYTRVAVDHFIGSYLTIRPAFTVPDLVIAYRTDISWDSS